MTAPAAPPRWRAWLRAAAPGLAALTSYRAGWLLKDVVAGLVLTALLVPQGMAYAQLAGLPPITGLYTSIVCLIAYALVGLGFLTKMLQALLVLPAFGLVYLLTAPTSLRRRIWQSVVATAA